jgi:N-acetylglutamate synthase-like GNAT family acetyltransferase
MDAVYRMGYDVWGGGDSLDVYLEWCRASPKYRKGEWFVLEQPDGKVVSALLAHRFPQGAGIGSIATDPARRKNGCASQLIEGVLNVIAKRGVEHVFLYSDIAPKFYERFGFTSLPAEHQYHPPSTCMVRTRSLQALLAQPGFTPPPYF